MTFNAQTDVDTKVLVNRARTEAEKIFAKDSTCRGRDFHHIFAEELRGQCPEVWLMTKHGYLDDTRAYHDIKEPDGTPIEIKVTKCEGYVFSEPGTLSRYAEKLRMFSPGKLPTRVYVFFNESDSSEFTFYGVFDWNGSQFLRGKLPTEVHF
jgi:hypothetical protein